ncbi:MAG TPA: VF530 family DNA-binding protein [Pontiellaceae bacterium]|nr:VF530 family DNA-binding protein [Pontiellaceae bacterium]
MSVEEKKNNPLHGLSAEAMVTALVEFYGWEILYAALGLNCFRMNPSISSAVKFLRKTDWARHKVENFYLYRFKQMPKARGEEFDLDPRDRGFANGVVPKDPMPLTVELIAEMKAEAEENYQNRRGGRR